MTTCHVRWCHYHHHHHHHHHLFTQYRCSIKSKNTINCATRLVKYRYTGWGQIKCSNTKIAISQKCVIIFAPNVAHLFLHTTLHKYVASCCIYLMYAKLTETQVLRTNFATEQKASTVHTLLTRTPACQTTQTWTPWLPYVRSHVGEVSGAETETEERDLALQTIWNDLHDETIRKSIFSFCIPLMTCNSI